MSEKSEAFVPRLIPERDAALFLGCAIGSLAKARKTGGIGHVRIGKAIFYTEDHLREFIESKMVPSRKEAG